MCKNGRFIFIGKLHFISYILFSFRNGQTEIMPVILHSMSDAQQRKLVFSQTNSNVRKIILATNIAESSITVPDVKYGNSISSETIDLFRKKYSVV